MNLHIIQELTRRNIIEFSYIISSLWDFLFWIRTQYQEWREHSSYMYMKVAIIIIYMNFKKCQLWAKHKINYIFIKESINMIQ